MSTIIFILLIAGISNNNTNINNNTRCITDNTNSSCHNNHTLGIITITVKTTAVLITDL